MDQIIFPSGVSGEIKAPSSKSFAQRACAAALLHNGTTVLKNYGHSNDEQAALEIIKRLGASVQVAGDEIRITSSDSIFEQKWEHPHKISCGESGLSMRLFAPIAALWPQPIQFDGVGSILNRPMNFFDELFPFLGVDIQSNNGKLPLILKGPIQAPNEFVIDGSLSSQFLTGLLFALSKAVKIPTRIYVKNLQSKPYISISLEVLKAFGVEINHQNFEVFEINPYPKKEVQTIHYSIEGDWSNAAFLCVAAAIAGELKICGLNTNSLQGDKAILEVLENCGAQIKMNHSDITVTHNALKAFTFDATHCPDLFPPLVALAAYCDGDSIIKGVQRLIHKESNRAESLQSEFKKMNIQIEFNDDEMHIIPNRVMGAKVHSHNDHRIAMACAVAGLRAEGNMIITDADAVNKSYPTFFQDLNAITKMPNN